MKLKDLISLTPTTEEEQPIQRVFFSTDFTGHYPVGRAAVVSAPDEETARLRLCDELINRGFDPTKGFTLTELLPDQTIILNDGNY